MKVLLIDDSLMQQKIARIYLEKGAGYEFIAANNGKEGIQLAQLEMPDIILLDIEMPEMSGEEVLKKIKTHENLKNIPIIICSGSDDPKLEEKAKELGAVACIKKPHGFSTLKNIVKKFISNEK